MSQERFVAAKSTQLSTRIGGDFVILNLVDENYYGLDEVGARIWELLQEPRSVDEIVSVVTSEYDVTPEQCESDVKTLLDHLVQQSLVTRAT